MRDLIAEMDPMRSAFMLAELGPVSRWTPADENAAMTVDALRNWLQFLWSQWTAPESAKKRARRGRPPETPPLLPYAIRPPELNARLAANAQPDDRSPSPAASGRKQMRRISIEELARLI